MIIKLYKLINQVRTQNFSISLLQPMTHVQRSYLHSTQRCDNINWYTMHIKLNVWVQCSTCVFEFHIYIYRHCTWRVHVFTTIGYVEFTSKKKLQCLHFGLWTSVILFNKVRVQVPYRLIMHLSGVKPVTWVPPTHSFINCPTCWATEWLADWKQAFTVKVLRKGNGKNTYKTVKNSWIVPFQN